jgi:histidine kinase/DNA gyrase B/HSP90-like ATPase
MQSLLSNRGTSVTVDLPSETERRAENAQSFRAFQGLNLRNVRDNVAEALTNFDKFSMLDEYTKHDISHIDSMLEIYAWLIPDETREAMTRADWLLLTISTYLHDFGLLVTRDEYDRRQSSDFPAYKARIYENADAAYRDYRAQLEKLNAEEREKFLYQEFVRSLHAPRIRSWLEETPDPRFGFDERIAQGVKSLLGSVEPTFIEDMGIVCESHHLNDLSDIKKYPLSRPYGSRPEEEANVQYAAILLRTADLLHITRDRVPPFSALVVNPRNPKSQVEWAKQAAVRRVRPRPDTDLAQAGGANTEVGPSGVIEVHARFTDSDGFFGLTSYLRYAQSEIAQSYGWAEESQAKGAIKYIFPWRGITTEHIEAKGFVARPFQFTIDQGKILDLLTGHTLYNDSGVVLRELVQNSLDAVRLASAVDGDAFVPRIEVHWSGARGELEVRDNGVGMSQRVIERNFLRVGSSHYQEQDFKKQFPSFASISRFGIGVLTAFMVADDVTVLTNSADDEQARLLNLRDVHGNYLVQLVDKSDSNIPELLRAHGTSVRLHLRPSATLSGVRELLRRWIVVPGCEVVLFDDGERPTVVGAASVSEALTEVLLESKLARLDENSKLVGSYGQNVDVRAVVEDGLEVAYAVEWSKWLQEWSFVSLAEGRFNDSFESFPAFGTCVGGVRVTVSPAGFSQGGIAAMANATGLRAPRTNVARSAIERTEEYDETLRRIYRAYVDHVTAEMGELESARASSLTKAAQEASYLTRDLTADNLAVLESRDLFKGQVRTVPALVLEENNERRRVSLQDLSAYEELATITSGTVQSMEALLASVRGASGSGSLAAVLSALGVDAEGLLPNVPLVCNIQWRSYYSELFFREWEISSLVAQGGRRTLTVHWRQADPANIKWVEVPDTRTLPRNLATLAEREFGRRGHLAALIARDEGVTSSGFDETLVRVHDRLLVLPGHGFQLVKVVHEDVPRSYRDWLIGWFISALVGHNSRSTPPGEGGVGVTRDVRANVTRILSKAGAFEYFDAESVEEALESANLEVLDVHRWDRRSDN